MEGPSGLALQMARQSVKYPLLPYEIKWLNHNQARNVLTEYIRLSYWAKNGQKSQIRYG